jgi:nucleotide-binding universal stress UspA family protein
MSKFKKILLPVDGSQHSQKAMEKATGLAVTMEAEIVLLYVTGAIPQFIKGKPREEAEKAQKEEAGLVLAPFQEFLNDKKVKYTTLVVPGSNAGKSICQVASTEGCDVIVMGSRGRGDWEGAMLGSVTHRVLAQCTTPVLVVR